MQTLISGTAFAAVWLLSLTVPATALTGGTESVWQMPLGDDAIVVWSEDHEAEARWFTFFWADGRVGNPSPGAGPHGRGLTAEIERLRGCNGRIVAGLAAMFRNAVLGAMPTRMRVGPIPRGTAAALES